jgi:ligand-binding sensor domain-containing protein
MIQFFKSFILFIFVSIVIITFLSCNEQSQTESLKNNRNDSLTNQIAVKTNLQKDSSSELATPPIVIRSALPSGYYSYTSDTAQISQYIRRIFQDSKGNLWFGTVGDGVCRYDGKYLIYFNIKDGFSGNSVQAIAEDKAGNIWFGTSGGISKYDGQQSYNEKLKKDTGKFINFTTKEGLSSNQVLSLCIDKSENIWIGTSEGVCRYNPNEETNINTNLFTSFSIPESGQKLQIKHIMEDKIGNIWFATNGGGVYRYNGTSLIHISETDGLGSNIVHCILQDKNGNMWFATQGGGLSRYNPLEELKTGTKSFTTYKEEKGSNEVWQLYEDKAGKIWVSSRGNIRCYDGKSFTTFSAEDGLTNCCVQSIYQDRAGNIWFGSGAGLFRYNPFATTKLNCKSFINVTKKGPWLKP